MPAALDKEKKLIKKLFRNKSQGQAIVMVAIAFVGLIAIVGLMTDGGMLLITNARLQRAVDSASIGAAQQFRKNFTTNDLTNSAQTFLNLNQPDASYTNVEVQTCASTGGTDPTLCALPLRKLVRVIASEQVNFGFMRVIGINSTVITANSIGEAASVDLMFVLDTSISMAAATDYTNNGNSCTGIFIPGTTTVDTNCQNTVGSGDDPSTCNANNTCEPMADLKADAGTFADYLFYPYDRVGIVALTSQTAGGTRDPVQLLALDSSQSDVDSTISNLKVFQPVVCPQPVSPQASPYPGPCLNYPVTNPVQNPEPFVGQEYPMFRNTSPNDPSTINSTDVGDGLLSGR